MKPTITAAGCWATLLKSSTVKVIPIDNIKRPKLAVKYLVVNHENEAGLTRASPAPRSVHNGKSIVKNSVTFKYVSQAEFVFAGVTALVLDIANLLGIETELALLKSYFPIDFKPTLFAILKVGFKLIIK